MTLYSYIVAFDSGFAPNPFHGYCTLATCKPKIRKKAEIGDWVVGTGSARKKQRNELIYAMEVSEVMSFDDYWKDSRFASKRPTMDLLGEVNCGDNIYHTDAAGWVQATSFHSDTMGNECKKKTASDTSVNRVLVANRYVYFGKKPHNIPFNLQGVCCPGIGHRIFDDKLSRDFIEWIVSLDTLGVHGEPYDFKRT